MKRALALTVSVFFLLANLEAAQTSTPTPPPLGVDFVDDSAPVLQFENYSSSAGGTPYSWNWVTVTNAAYYLGTERYYGPDRARGGVVHFDFVGDGLAIYGWKATNGDPAATLTIDGNAVTFSYYNASTLYQQKLIEVTGLEYGLHRAQLKPSGVGYINVDAIHIYPQYTTEATPAIVLTVIAGVTIERTPEVTPAWRAGYGIDGQAVAIDYRADSGQVALVIMKAGVLLVALILAVVLMRGRLL